MCRTRGNCSIFEGIDITFRILQNYYNMCNWMKLWNLSGNSLLFTYYKIATCVGQEGTVAFLNEFITFNTLQNYYMCRKKVNYWYLI